MSKKFLTHKMMQYIESIIYILTIIIVIFANTYGPVYIKMFPVLFLLGIFGKLVFGRPVVTSIFGTSISLCIIYMRGNTSVLENIVASISTGVSIALGEFLGDYLKIIYKKLQHNKHVSKKKVRRAYIYSGILIIVSFILHDFINGNVFTYIKCKEKLYSYLSSTYGSEVKFDIVSAKYNFLNNQSYTLKVKNNEYNMINRFVIYLNDSSIIQDGYKDSIIAKDNVKLEKDLTQYVNNVENNIIDNNKTKISAEYVDLDNIKVTITQNIDELNEEKIIDSSKNIDSIIKELNDFKYYDKIKQVYISVNNNNNKTDNVSSIIDLNKYIEYLNQNKDESYKYIENSLSFEYIEEIM